MNEKKQDVTEKPEKATDEDSPKPTEGRKPEIKGKRLRTGATGGMPGWSVPPE